MGGNTKNYDFFRKCLGNKTDMDIDRPGLVRINIKNKEGYKEYVVLGGKHKTHEFKGAIAKAINELKPDAVCVEWVDNKKWDVLVSMIKNPKFGIPVAMVSMINLITTVPLYLIINIPLYIIKGMYINPLYIIPITILMGLPKESISEVGVAKKTCKSLKIPIYNVDIRLSRIVKDFTWGTSAESNNLLKKAYKENKKLVEFLIKWEELNKKQFDTLVTKRNEAMVENILKVNKDKVLIVCGMGHLPGIVEELNVRYNKIA